MAAPPAAATDDPVMPPQPLALGGGGFRPATPLPTLPERGQTPRDRPHTPPLLRLRPLLRRRLGAALAPMSRGALVRYESRRRRLRPSDQSVAPRADHLAARRGRPLLLRLRAPSALGPLELGRLPLLPQRCYSRHRLGGRLHKRRALPRARRPRERAHDASTSLVRLDVSAGDDPRTPTALRAIELHRHRRHPPRRVYERGAQRRFWSSRGRSSVDLPPAVARQQSSARGAPKSRSGGCGRDRHRRRCTQPGFTRG